MLTPRRSAESLSIEIPASNGRQKPQHRRSQRSSMPCSRRAVFICTFLAVAALTATWTTSIMTTSKGASQPGSLHKAKSAALSMAAGHNASNTTDSEQLIGGYSARYLGPVASAYGVAGGYWRLEVNDTLPTAAAEPQPWSKIWRQWQEGADSSSCYQKAMAVQEPYTEFYRPRGRQAQALPGGVQRAVWQWEGTISRALFESVPFLLRDHKGCTHCTYVLRYKVLQGRLYALSKRRWRQMDRQEKEAEMVEEMLLAALHVYKVPDAEFLVHLGDGAPEGLPMLQVNINRGHKRAGFAMPKRMWMDAMGPTQLRTYAGCLEARYPQGKGRIPRAVWRGSNTDTKLLWPNESTILDIPRSRLVLYGRWYPQWLDVQYTSYSQHAFDTDCVERLVPLGSKMKSEDFNKYSLILDVDGNGWSDRFRNLSHFNTPILKQASNLTAFFEHVMAHGVAVEHFAPDLHDLPVRAASLLAEAAAAPERLQRTTEQHQALAHYLLNHVALLEAMAYAVTTVARLSAWTVKEEAGYELIPFQQCCHHNRALPHRFVHAVRAMGGDAGPHTLEQQHLQRQQYLQGKKVDAYGAGNEMWQRERGMGRVRQQRGSEQQQQQEEEQAAKEKQEQQQQELVRAERLRRQRLGLPGGTPDD